MLQKNQQAYGKCHPNEVLKCQVFVEGIAEGEGLVIRRSTEEYSEKVAEKKVVNLLKEHRLVQTNNSDNQPSHQTFSHCPTRTNSNSSFAFSFAKEAAVLFLVTMEVGSRCNKPGRNVFLYCSCGNENQSSKCQKRNSYSSSSLRCPQPIKRVLVCQKATGRKNYLP